MVESHFEFNHIKIKENLKENKCKADQKLQPNEEWGLEDG